MFTYRITFYISYKQNFVFFCLNFTCIMDENILCEIRRIKQLINNFKVNAPTTYTIYDSDNIKRGILMSSVLKPTNTTLPWISFENGLNIGIDLMDDIWFFLGFYFDEHIPIVIFNTAFSADNFNFEIETMHDNSFIMKCSRIE